MPIPRGIRPRVTGPDGRVWLGQWPNSLPNRGEWPYMRVLAEQVGGVIEAVLPCGRADVLSSTTAFEVEPVKSWRHGAQQAFAYGAITGTQPAVALFGRADYLPIYLRIRDRMMPLALWVWDGYRFVEVTSRQTASLKSLGALPERLRTPPDR